MKPKDVKDRLADAIETENPPGIGYYGAELDEAEVEADEQRMDQAIRTEKEAKRDSGTVAAPLSRYEGREKPD
jgi:hypothetical protein